MQHRREGPMWGTKPVPILLLWLEYASPHRLGRPRRLPQSRRPIMARHFDTVSRSISYGVSRSTTRSESLSTTEGWSESWTEGWTESWSHGEGANEVPPLPPHPDRPDEGPVQS